MIDIADSPKNPEDLPQIFKISTGILLCFTLAGLTFPLGD